ncbi:MAG: hypothetical protein WCC60_23890 [Ilumatobacteraceae bacterium]
MAGKDSVAARVDAIGADEVGRRYLHALAAPSDDPDNWIVDAVWFGNDLRENGRAELPLGLRWDLAMATLEACPDNDGDLWLLGDGPFDQLAAEPGMIKRFHAERETRPKLLRLFEAMRRELPSEGVTDGWWFD